MTASASRLTCPCRRRDAERDAERGFSLIELIITMVIIGILAAIAVPMILSQHALAQNSAATSDLVNLHKAMVAYSVDHNGTYTADTTSLAAYGLVRSTQAAPTITVSGIGFCAELASDSSSTFYVTNGDNVQSGTC